MNFEKYLTAIFITIILSCMLTAALAQEDEIIKLDPNKATVLELIKIPHISKEMAESLIMYRDQNGDFLMIEELMNVEGFDSKMIKRLKPYLKLGDLDSPDC